LLLLFFLFLLPLLQFLRTNLSKNVYRQKAELGLRISQRRLRRLLGPQDVTTASPGQVYRRFGGKSRLQASCLFLALWLFGIILHPDDRSIIVDELSSEIKTQYSL
jgi:hypothetical protein